MWSSIGRSLCDRYDGESRNQTGCGCVLIPGAAFPAGQPTCWLGIQGRMDNGALRDVPYAELVARFDAEVRSMGQSAEAKWIDEVLNSRQPELVMPGFGDGRFPDRRPRQIAKCLSVCGRDDMLMDVQRTMDDPNVRRTCCLRCNVTWEYSRDHGPRVASRSP